MDIKNFEAEELSGLIITKPKFALKGSVDPEGVLLSDVSFSDTVSALSGSGYALLNVKNSIFDSANLDLILSNPLNSESVSVNASVTNPMGEDFSGEHLTEDFFFNAEVNVNQLELSHVLENQHSDDTLTALVTASGTIENPYVSLSISSFSMQAGGMPLLASGDAAILENKISVSDFRALWNGFEVKKINADIDIASFNGSANANLNFAMGDKILEAPFNVLLTNLSGEGSSNGFPEFYSLELSIPKLEGNIFTEDFPISASVIRSPGRFDIMTDENLGAYGELLDDGSLNFTVDSSKPLHFELGGKLSGNVMDLHLDNVYLDVSRFAYIINSDFFTIYNGVVTGSAEITGLANAPGIDGAIVVSDLDLNLPSFVPEHITAKELFVEMIQNEIQIPETVFNIQDTNFAASAFFSLDRLTFGVMEVNLETSSKKGIPIDVRIPLLRIRGNASAKATLLMQDNSLDLSGDIGLNNTDIILIDNFLSLLNNEQESVGSQNSQAVPMGMNIDLNLLVGQKVQVELNPILRGIIAPNTNVAFTFDSSADLWTLKGDVVLRGGEVSYLSRNFYLKEGRIIMNENQGSFNPMVTFRAETREHDSAGNPVTITLSAIRQNVANFHPSLYATPAKSENEIMSILGQIATGDSSSVGEIAVAAGDYLVQAAVFRKIEGALRDLGNFDIFSIRNSFFQNTVKNGLNLDNNNEVINTQKIEYGKSAELPDDLVVAGYIFKGWSTNEKWWAVDHDMNVYPILAYEDTAETPYYEQYSYADGENIIYLNTSTEDAVIYYTIDGTEPDETSIEYIPEEGIPCLSNMTIMAFAVKEQYNASYVSTFDIEYIESYDCYVSFDIDNDNAPLDSVVIQSGDKLPRPNTPTKEGYVFSGWYLEPEYNNAYDFSEPVYSDMELYAKWSNHSVLGDVNNDGKVDK